MEAFLVSAGVVALGELGDKTQLLALVLATRFRKPWPIAFGILVATLANHTFAGLVGQGIHHLLEPETLRWTVGLSFLAVAAWALVPDRLSESQPQPRGARSVFVWTAMLFFVAEMGDKTQIATVMLAARFDALAAVIAGTTLGMLLADLPVVWLGRAAANRIPLRAARIAAAALFAATGIAALLGLGG